MMSIWPRHTMITGKSGKAYSCALLRHCFIDLFRHGHIGTCEMDIYMDALSAHVNDGILPGDTRFFSVMTGSSVYWTTMIDDVMNMYELALNFWELSDSEDEQAVMVSEPITFPDNIGVFRMLNFDPEDPEDPEETEPERPQDRPLAAEAAKRWE